MLVIACVYLHITYQQVMSLCASLTLKTDMLHTALCKQPRSIQSVLQYFTSYIEEPFVFLNTFYFIFLVIFLNRTLLFCCDKVNLIKSCIYT